MIGAVYTTDAGAGRRRRLVVGSEGVLVLGEERRAVGRGYAWVIVSAYLVEHHEVPRCALDVREAWAAHSRGAA